MSPKELEELIKRHKQAYENGTPTISDEEFDNLVDQLREVDPTNTELPRVGAPVVGDFEKVHHQTPMGSQDKANTLVEVERWSRRLKKIEVSAQLKLDGLTLVCNYVGGHLKTAVTRGDGLVGENILSNAKLMQGIPLTCGSFTGWVRGEVILKRSIFEAHFRPLGGFRSPRNTAVGTSRRKEHNEMCKHLEFIAYDSSIRETLNTEHEVINWLKINNFNTVDETVLIGLRAIGEFYRKHQSERLAYDYDIDGLVLKSNDLAEQKELGSPHGTPKGQIAFKFSSVVKQTKVKDIHWGIGVQGTLTPVAIVEPVEVSNSIIEKVSLANIDLAVKSGIGIGAVVNISRAGDVIPFIEEVLEKGKPLVIPLTCPYCEAEVVQEGKFLICIDDCGCSGQTQERVLHWVKTQEMEGIGVALIDALVSIRKVRKISDLYLISEKDIMLLKGWGAGSAKKLMEQIDRTRTLPLVKFLKGLAIPDVGERMAEKLQEVGLDTLEKVFHDNAKIKEVWPGLQGDNMLRGLAKRAQEAFQLAQVVTIKAEVGGKEMTASGKLAGLSFAVTGKIAVPRKDFEQQVVDNGGSVKSMSKGLTYLVTEDPDSGSSKNEAAKKLGTKVISYTQFLDLLK